MAGRPDEGPSGVLLLDKAGGITSTRALAQAKRLLGSRKAGHTGTLDPFATGLLPLAFGDATKFTRFLLDSAKGYLATLQLGRTTTTGDPEGAVVSTLPVSCSDARIAEVLASLVGPQLQVPPMHSALHHEGRRLYEWAREGMEVPREPRQIVIYGLESVGKIGDLLTISVNCSKGTYIRTLGMDIGALLGCGATLLSLRRTRVGPFKLDEALGLEQLEAMGQADAVARLRPPESLLGEIPSLELAASDAVHISQGRRISVPSVVAAGELALFGPSGRLLGVGRSDGHGAIEPVRLVATRVRAESPDSA